MTFTYSFACPFCHGSWEFEQFAKIAKDVFNSFEGVGTCPLCRGTFAWVEPGTLKGTRWYAGKKHYKSHPCPACGGKIDGKRKTCNEVCRQRYHRMKKRQVSRPGA